MRRFSPCFSLVLVVWLFLAIVPALADIGFVYTCDQVPHLAPSAWNVSPNGPSNSVHTEQCGGSCNGITNSVVTDGGSNVWKVVDANTSYCGIWKNANLSGMNLGRGVTIAANIRCEENSSDSSFTLGINKTNSAVLFLCVRTDGCLLMDREGVVKSSYSFTADTTGYHRYYLTAQNPPGVGDDQCVWTVYRDGQSVMTYTPGLLANWTASNAFFAGHGGPYTTNIGSGTGTWYFDWIACRTDGAFSPSQWDPMLPPPAPTVTAPANGSTVIILNPTIQWTNTYYDSYEVHVTTTNNPTGAIAWDSGVVVSTANSCTPANLANGSYYIFIRLRAPAGWGPWSAEGYRFTVDAPTSPPVAPTMTAPVPGSTLNTRNVVIGWTGGTRDGYQVHINTTNLPNDADGWDSGSVMNKANDCLSGSLANGSYYAFARLRNLAGWGEWSTGVNFTVDVSSVLPGAPVVVTPMDGSNVALQKPVVRWIGDAHDKYEVHVNTTNTPADTDAWTSGEVSSADDWCDSGILTNGAYHVFVRVHNDAGWGPWSAGRAFTANFTGSEMKKGWIFLRDDLPYHLELLTHAREYHVNHLQISHDIMMYAWQPINDVAKRSKINQLIDTAHANGVSEVVLWSHEIMYRDLPPQYRVGGKVNLDDPGFWTWMDSEYETLFTVCPNADGLVFTFSESDVDFDNRFETIHTGKTPIDTYAKAIETLWNVCHRHNKSLYIRTWGSDKWIRDGLMRNDPAIWLMNKATGAADWNVIQEDYDMVGTAPGHPELMEFDFTGEYWGLTYTPWAGIDFTRHLWSEFGLPRGVDGMAARIDRDNGNAVQTPNRINMAALDILADSPDISSDDIYSYWSNHWFGPSGAKIASSLKRTFDITNACYGLPTVYPFSYWVAINDIKSSTFDLNCVAPSLKADTNYQSGVTAYDLFHGRMMNAAAKLGIGVPTTLFGDFTPIYSNETSPTCTATIVDASTGLNPSSFYVEYSTDGGSSWTPYSNITVTAEGSSTNPYHITANSVPFGQVRVAKNKLRFGAANLAGGANSQVFTVRGSDVAYATLGTDVETDGINYAQGGDGDTTPATMGGRSCRTPATTGDSNFYFQTDEGFAFDRSPRTVYLQVDYYGSSGSIAPWYDSIWRNDEPLPPVYLSGGTTWRTATWKLDSVNFGHRLSGWLDFALRVPGGSGTVFISDVRLSYSPPAGTLAQPAGLRTSALSPTSAGLVWTPVAGATTYQVCRDGVFVGWSNTPSFTDSGLSPNTQYAYTVTAFNASNHSSPASRNAYITALAAPVSPTTITSDPLPGTWQTSDSINFTAVGGFGAGKVAYYQYAWDQSPNHVWTGNEPTWPATTGNPPSGAGWDVWRATSSPVNQAPWLMYEGSTQQRCMSEETTLENGIPTWILNDQGRVFGTKGKFAIWPNLPTNRDTGMTVVGRIRCVDEPSGWYNTSTNFGINLLDCPDIGISIRPDSLQLGGDQWQPADNGYTYHTYTLTLKNAGPGNNNTAVYSLYRDGSFVSSMVQGPSGPSARSGPFFGHWRSDATGGWAWQWIAWNATGAYVPSNSATLTTTASQYGSYYLHIRGFNSDGAPDAAANLGPYYYWNGSTPVDPTVIDDGDYTTDDAIHAKWSPVAPDGGTAISYEYGIGTAAGLDNIVPFADIGPSLEVIKTGLHLAEGSTYYVTVRAIAGATAYSGSSDGIIVAPKRQRVAHIKKLADDDPVALYGKTVTAVFPDYAYIQDKNGMGIRVVTARPIAEGDIVDLAGTIIGSKEERWIEADSVFKRGAETPKPHSLSTAGIGGSEYGEPGTGKGQPATKAYQWFVDRQTKKRVRSTVELDVPGLNTIGLLVTTYGRVTSAAGNSFYLDDGSGLDEYYDTKRDGPAGIKVRLPENISAPAPGTFLSVTGITSCYKSRGHLNRLLLVRRLSDLQTF
ncbi:MAG: hypothetical protein Q7T82_01615 [Armatimonadota bacterium]|nr:hypothetical protein [Armatimonadota bacterium]